MRVLKLLLILGCGFLCCTADAATAKVLKVLPHFLDQQGRTGLSPSLYDRDAYQAILRSRPEQRSGLRFDVQWKTALRTPLTLRAELRGVHDQKPTTAVIETPTKRRGLFSTWSEVKLTGKDYQQFGELRAWRVTLWDGQTLLAEQTSFLW
jgi:hypothetical protein